jgi:PucR family transcriptional regulator, purine catabolism regulatory protein
VVSAAVAGEDLTGVARSASEALGSPVAIALSARGPAVLWPPERGSAPQVGPLLDSALGSCAVGAGLPAGVAGVVPVRIGREAVGVVVAFGDHPVAPDQHAWLEAAAAAAAVSSLMQESQQADLDSACREFVRALAARPPADVAAMVAQARRLGVDLSEGGIAFCVSVEEEPEHQGSLAAEVDGVLVGLMANGPAVAGFGTYARRRDPADLHDALREAHLLFRLRERPDAPLAGQEETYRLLIGVLLHDRDELEQLRAGTILPLARYDAEHDTDLVATLRTFLAHHGSTTDTAEAMSLHRHTVGYRLTRVYEVSGLSPYESDGRERLGLGLKAQEILEADTTR